MQEDVLERAAPHEHALRLETALVQLVGRGVDVSDIRHMGSNGWAPGAHPEHTDYGSFADFKDPDGNTWVLQEVRKGKSAA